MQEHIIDEKTFYIPYAGLYQPFEIEDSQEVKSDKTEQTSLCAKVQTKGGFSAASMKLGLTMCSASYGFSSKSQFYIGSITKHITTFMFLKTLKAQNPNENLKELINKPLAELLPESELLKQIDMDWTSKISVFELCTHKSGLHSLSYLDTEQDKKPEELGKKIDSTLLIKSFEFSEENYEIKKFWYSNANFYLLGKLLEEMHGDSYNNIFDEMIAKPLCMTNSYAPVEGNYNSIKDDGRFTKLVANLNEQRTPDFANYLGSANVVSTPHDILKFADHFLASPDEDVVEIRNLMLEDYANDLDAGTTSKTGYYFALDSIGRDSIGHSGSMVSHKTVLGYNIVEEALFCGFSNHHVELNQIINLLNVMV